MKFLTLLFVLQMAGCAYNLSCYPPMTPMMGPPPRPIPHDMFSEGFYKAEISHLNLNENSGTK